MDMIISLANWWKETRNKEKWSVKADEGNLGVQYVKGTVLNFLKK